MTAGASRADRHGAGPALPPDPPIDRHADRPTPTFAHASEAEMARILDFYDVAWAYEPHVFPILWNLDGAVVESFAPDFYLPDFDIYLEMTTLRQKLVRKKNRKLRRLRELYPDVRIKLLYARDFRALMLKYGKLALASALSGTSGQVVPDRPARPTESTSEPTIEPTTEPTSPGPTKEPPRRRAKVRRRPPTSALALAPTTTPEPTAAPELEDEG